MGYQVLPATPPHLWQRFKLDEAHPDRILTYFGVLEPPVDVFGIAAAMGVNVHLVHQPGWDGACKSTPERADVWIDANVSPTRQRFTLAHELGHLMLDPLGMEYRDTRITSFGNSWTETRANAWAADLLMPSWMVRTYYSPGLGGAVALARKFDVSLRAAEIRIEKLFR